MRPRALRGGIRVGCNQPAHSYRLTMAGISASRLAPVWSTSWRRVGRFAAIFYLDFVDKTFQFDSQAERSSASPRNSARLGLNYKVGEPAIAANRRNFAIYKAPPRASAHDWTGWYIGINGGGSRQRRHARPGLLLLHVRPSARGSRRSAARPV